MKIIRQFILVLALAGSTLPLGSKVFIKANADNSNDYSIHQGCVFDVDVVNDNGGFDHKGCYSDFNSAKNAMNSLGQDAVIRNSASKSPTKIIAMMSGMVITNPYRDNGRELSYYYMNQDFSGSSTYSRQYAQAQYHDTAWYDTSNGGGAVSMTMNGFDGYVKMAECDLVPIKYYTKHLAIQLGGNNPEDPVYTLYPEMDHYTVSTGSYGNKEMSFYSYWGWSNSAARSAQTYAYPDRTGVVLPAADWMSEGTTYYSANGYDFYTDQAMTLYAGTYYNYYQFLPLRTKSNLTADDLQNFLNQSGYAGNSVMSGNAQAFIDAQNNYGVNALIVYAMALHESGYGTSNLARTRANLFGWNAVDSDPNQAASYSGIYTAVATQMGKNLNGYLDVDDGRHFGMAVGNKGNGFNVCYASDQFWGINIASLAYQIDRASGFKDLNKITLGVVNSDSSVYFTKNAYDDTKWYDIKNAGGTYGGYFPKAYLVPVLGEANNYYETQTSDHLTNGRLTRASSSNMQTYDFNNNVAYIRKDWLQLLSNGSPASNGNVNPTPAPTPTPSTEPTAEPTTEPTAEPTTEPTTSPDDGLKDKANASYKLYRGVTNTSFNEDTNVVTIDGIGYFSGAVARTGDVKDEIYLVNIETGEKTVISAESTEDSDMKSFFAGYQATGFKAQIDLDDINPGNYYLELHVVNGSHDESAKLYFQEFFDSYQTKGDDGYTTTFYASQVNFYRLEISKEIQKVDTSNLKKSSNITPLFGMGSVSLKDGHLNIKDGFAVLRNASMTADDNVSYKMYLEDEDGKVTSYPVTAKKSTIDFSKVLKSNYTQNYASFDADLDLSSLEKGTYRIYLSVSTNDYNDTFEIFYSGDDKYSETSYGRTYTLQSTNVRARYILTIE
ncbi:glucosaminidase domain-containing protein [Stecheria sp. CLA-KB-P133]|uniref:Glucosaminidase domain-containing protein n=1 Tax=Grylomicrobium aquisgranensis TaxID=2926318 RepID=A0AB35U3X5_9FIRM|nr:glucosaminidase domain-containing protein [Stecheria sp. CLA-KB-P133]